MYRRTWIKKSNQCAFKSNTIFIRKTTRFRLIDRNFKDEMKFKAENAFCVTLRQTNGQYLETVLSGQMSFFFDSFNCAERHIYLIKHLSFKIVSLV